MAVVPAIAIAFVVVLSLFWMSVGFSRVARWMLVAIAVDVTRVVKVSSNFFMTRSSSVDLPSVSTILTTADVQSAFSERSILSSTVHDCPFG